jgi:hypothetical protein
MWFVRVHDARTSSRHRFWVIPEHGRQVAGDVDRRAPPQLGERVDPQTCRLVIEAVTAYIASWLTALPNDNHRVVIAAGREEKAADHILGTSKDVN